jgi:hypothetical protein
MRSASGGSAVSDHDRRPERLESGAHGEVLAPKQVAAAKLDGIHAETFGEPVQYALPREAGLVHPRRPRGADPILFVSMQRASARKAAQR